MACDLAWNSILKCDCKGLGKALTDTMYCWKNLLPETVPDDLDSWWKEYLNEKYICGCLYSGAGGGFLMVITNDTFKKEYNIKTNPNNKLLKNGFQVTVNSKLWR